MYLCNAIEWNLVILSNTSVSAFYVIVPLLKITDAGTEVGVI